MCSYVVILNTVFRILEENIDPKKFARVHVCSKICNGVLYNVLLLEETTKKNEKNENI